MSVERFDIGLVTEDEKLVKRVQEIVDEFQYTVKHFPTVDEFLNAKVEFSVLVAFMKNDKNPNSAAELAQGGKYVDESCYAICGASKGLPKEAATFAKKSGADLILLEDELHLSSKLEFVITQVLRASYLPLKASDLTVGREIPFDVCHLLPQRKKFIKFIFKGNTVDEAKLKKIADVGEVYVHRSQIEDYKKYTESSQDMSAAGLARRCRAQFMALYSSYSQLVLLLTDQSERASFGEGEKLLTSCRSLCQELLGTLGAYENAFDIINNSTIGEFGSVERAPAIAAYAALFSLQAGLPAIDDIMLVALLADLGLVFMTPSITKKLREDRSAEMTPEEVAIFEKYPQMSMDVVLDRKVSLKEKMRNVLLCVRERADGMGFRKVPGQKLPVESQMIQFCREFDQRTVLRLGKSRVDKLVVRKQMVDESQENLAKYSSAFLSQLRGGL